MKSDGTVWAWGYNLGGILGDGTTTERHVPVQVSGLSGTTSIALSSTHSLALKSDGTVWAWGYNLYGQLGDGTTSGHATPVQVSGLSGATAVAAGYEHSLALGPEGVVWAWGRNSTGQLGDDTTTGRATPVPVSGLSGVAAIAGGNAHSLALGIDGTFWAWGNNSYGQLGDGTTVQRNAPIQVSGLTGVTVTAGGGYHSLAIQSSNSPLVAVNDSYSIPEDTSLNVSASGVLGNDSDADGDQLTAVLVSTVSHGSLTLNADGSFSYTPAANYSGGDGFTYKANDGTVDSDLATVSITVNAVNDPPVFDAIPDQTVDEDAPLQSISITGVGPGGGTDEAGQTVTVSATSSDPALIPNPTVSGTGSTRTPTYQPEAGASGTATITVTADDGQAANNTFNRAFTITVNAQPLLKDQAFEPGSFTGFYSSDDYRHLAQSFTPGWTGKLARVDVYIKRIGQAGFLFEVRDASSGEPQVDAFAPLASVTVPAAGVPTSEGWFTVDLSAGSLPVAAGQKLAIVLRADPYTAGVDGIAWYRLWQSGGTGYQGGKAFGRNPHLDPNWGSLSNDDFGFRTFIAVAANFSPVVADQSVATDEDASKGVTLTGSDADGDTLTYTLVTAPAHGALTGTPPNVTYTPAANYNGSDSFTFKANDGKADSNVATVTITVNAVNDPPVASSQSPATAAGASVGITLSASDVDGDALSYSIVTGPSHGDLSGTPPDLTYTPAAGYAGSDSFTFTANDGMVDSSLATVAIMVGLDQYYEPAAAGASSSRLDKAQTFTVGTTGRLVRVDVDIQRTADTDLLFDVRPTSGGKPVEDDNLALVSLRIPAAEVPPTRGFFTIDLGPSGLEMTAGQLLAIVLRGDQGIRGYTWFGTGGGNGYTAGGEYGRDAGDGYPNWSTSFGPDGDWTFRTFVAPTVKPGDADGSGVVDAVDITRVERIIAGLDPATPGADANQDGLINSQDITKTERIIAGLD